ncbi:MAG TPA: LptE family protein [Cytophagales bacterium]|nr:LptE family protein [Cytophagales bacterium]
MSKKSKIASSNIFNIIILSFSLLFITSSCGVYSFSGANIPPEIKSLTVMNIYNNAGSGPANLAQQLTQDLKDYFQQNTNLNLINTGGDLVFDGSIEGYVTTPVAPTVSSGTNTYPTTSKTRLTITVKINYTNTKDEKANYEESFVQYEDFDEATQSLTSVENELIEKINEKLVFDIFNKTFSNW